MLQQALWAGGTKGGAASVAAAMEVLRGIDVDTYLKQHAHDVDAPATAVEDVWGWSLSRWTDPRQAARRTS